jgi:cytochrome P450
MKPRLFDVASREYKRNPYPTLARMVAEGPVVRIRYPLIGTFWAVTTYDAVQELLRDHRTFVRDPRTAGLKKGANLPWWFPRSFRPMTESMLLRDEPDHRRLRSLVEQAFVRQSIEQLRPRFAALAAELIDELVAQQRRTGRPVDLVSGLARPFPLAVICELLGLPKADRPMFIRHSERLAIRLNLWALFRMLSGMRHVVGYIRQRVAAARDSPSEGLISALVAVHDEGDRLSDDELVAMIVLLLFAGHVTTVHLIGAGLYTLLVHQDQRQALQSDWSLVSGAVNEMLRYISPVQSTKPLLAVRELTWHRQPLARGESILAWLAAANMDPRQFDRPEVFDIRRSPNPHVAFGAGIHNCLGWKLAVVEAEIAVQQLLERFPNVTLAIPAERAVWSRQPGTRGMESLPVQLFE